MSVVMGIAAARPGGRGQTVAARLLTNLDPMRLEFHVLQPPTKAIGETLGGLLEKQLDHIVISPDEVGVRIFEAVCEASEDWHRAELYQPTAPPVGMFAHQSSEPNRLAQDTGSLFAALYEEELLADGDLLKALQELRAGRGADGSPVWAMPQGTIGGQLEASILAFAAWRKVRG